MTTKDPIGRPHIERQRTSPISSLAAAGIGFDGTPFTGDEPQTKVIHPKGWAQYLVDSARAVWTRVKVRASVKPEQGQEAIEDDDIDHMHAWSITARLAAVPVIYLDQVPPAVADLIRESKGLHHPT